MRSPKYSPNSNTSSKQNGYADRMPDPMKRSLQLTTKVSLETENNTKNDTLMTCNVITERNTVGSNSLLLRILKCHLLHAGILNR